MACDAVLQAHEKVHYQALGQILSAVAYVVLGWIWLDMGYGLMGVIWANLVSRVVRLVIMVPLMFRRHRSLALARSGRAATPSLAWMLNLGWPLFLSTTFGIIYNKVDTVMLKEMVGIPPRASTSWATAPWT